MRSIQCKIKSKAVKKTARALKKSYFFCVETLGGIFFFLARACRLIAPIQPFSKGAVKNILVIRTDRIGDVILSLPALRALRQAYPESFIAFLTTPYTEELVRHNEDINTVILYRSSFSLAEKMNFFRNLRRFKFDVALVLCPYFRPALIAYLSGAPHRIGYPVNASKFLLTTVLDKRALCRHERETALEAARAIGADTHDMRPHLAIDAASCKYAQDFFEKHSIASSDTVIAIHPGGYQMHTQWPPARYAELIQILITQHNVKAILLGGPKDQEAVAAVKKGSPETVIVAPFNTSLLQVAALIARCSVFVGNNSGPMHIAAAAGTPVVALFGPIHPREHENKWAPYGDEHIVVRKQMECEDCHPGHCAHLRCRERIEVNDVVNAVLTVLSRPAKDHGKTRD